MLAVWLEGVTKFVLTTKLLLFFFLDNLDSLMGERMQLPRIFYGKGENNLLIRWLKSTTLE